MYEMTAIEAGALFLIVGVAFFFLRVIFGPLMDRLLTRLIEWLRRRVFTDGYP